MTRSSANWSVHPGGYDALHCERHIWPSEQGAYGIPSLQPQRFDLPPNLRLLPYRLRLDRLDRSRDCCHFYLDDYRFESTWTRLEPGARHVAGYSSARMKRARNSRRAPCQFRFFTCKTRQKGLYFLDSSQECCSRNH